MATPSLRPQRRSLLLPFLCLIRTSRAFLAVEAPPPRPLAAGSPSILAAADHDALPPRGGPPRTTAFVQGGRRGSTQLSLSSRRGGGGSFREDDDGGGLNDDDLAKFLDPNYRESESLLRAREFLSDHSAPITADLASDVGDDDQDDEEDNELVDEAEPRDAAMVGEGTSSGAPEDSRIPKEVAVVPQEGGRPANALDLAQPGLELTKEGLERNPYMAVISRLSPSELISRFTTTAHPRVQNAVRQTILGMLGGLPKLAFETTTFTTAQRLASLMFQLQMTGYMFKNAEYLLSLRQSLGDYSDSQYLLTGDEDDDGTDLVDPQKTKIRGKIRIPLGDPGDEEARGEIDGGSANTKNGTAIPALEVDAAAYMGELRQEVAQLRRELETARQAKEEALRKDLLLYIRTLPEQELRSLTNTMSADVLVAMKGLVNAVLAGISEEGQEPITPQTVTEQSGEAMAQLCMWQLAIGYNLRTLEVREEMKKSIAAGPNVSGPISASGSTPDDGVFE